MTALIYPVINCSGTGEEIVFETNTTEKVQEGSYSQMIMDAYEAMERMGKLKEWIDKAEKLPSRKRLSIY